MADCKAQPFAQTLLERAFSPDTAATHYNERVIKRPLPIRATSPEPSARAVRRQALNERKAVARKRSKNKPRPLSAAQKRKLCLNDIPKEHQKYALYEPLHNLWTQYMQDILGLNHADRAAHIIPSASGQLLASADMHYANVTVVRSRCVSRVGLEGLIVHDTRFTFVIITKRNVVKSVPKEHTIFRFEISLPVIPGKEPRKPLVLELNGEQFQARAADRANRKFRMHYQPDI
ncbi:hypothetical protein NX059_000770 [Plenodomus lindquistii]|nr:hypothetical protein NX059_000770 [Plenodomus lindquistii]